jgi:hypothetical protein
MYKYYGYDSMVRLNKNLGEKTMLQEFKKFAMRGNVVDMAVGIIIGAAFGKLSVHSSAISSCRQLA